MNEPLRVRAQAESATGPVDSDLWAIAATKARYFRFMDLKQWTDMRQLFTTTATFEHPTIGTFSNIEDAIDAVANALEGFWTAHEAGIPDISLHSADRATAVFAMSSTSTPPGHASFARTFGHYYDTFSREHGDWKIESLKLVSSYRDL